MLNSVDTSTQSQQLVEVNQVLKNTYALLSMTLLFSALTAFISLNTSAVPLNPFLTIGIYLGLLFLTHKTANSGWGILSVFALTGFLGYTLGPILNYYLSLSNGAELVMVSFLLTAFTFLGLSAYVLTSKKDMSFLSNFVLAGSIILIATIVIGLFVNLSALQMVISAGVVLLSSAMILLQTSQIIQGGERNYILATVTLYVSIYNIFLSLLQILGSMSSDD